MNKQVKPIHGAVFLPKGSHIIFSSGILGKCFLVIDLYAIFVTINMFEGDTTPSKRLKVCCIIELCSFSIFRYCFGSFEVPLGQNLVPIPPAIITA